VRRPLFDFALGLGTRHFALEMDGGKWCRQRKRYVASFTGGAARLTWILTAGWPFDFACRARSSGLKRPPSRRLVYPQSHPFSMASQASVPSNPFVSAGTAPMRPHLNALLGCFSWQHDVPALDRAPSRRRLELMLARYGALSRRRVMAAQPGHAFRPGLQRLGFRGCGSLSHIGELDTWRRQQRRLRPRALPLVRASQRPCGQVQGVQGPRGV
jgi:hypothetical protein